MSKSVRKANKRVAKLLALEPRGRKQESRRLRRAKKVAQKRLVAYTTRKLKKI